MPEQNPSSNPPTERPRRARPQVQPGRPGYTPPSPQPSPASQQPPQPQPQQMRPQAPPQPATIPAQSTPAAVPSTPTPSEPEQAQRSLPGPPATPVVPAPAAVPPHLGLLAGESTRLPAAQSLIRQLLGAQTLKDQKFYLVVVPDGGMPSVEEFDDIAELELRIVALLETDAFLFPFMGYWFGITAGPLRYLQTPFGLLPLHRTPAPDEVQVDRTGWVGKERPELEVPASTGDDEDDEDGTEDADGTDVVPDGDELIGLDAERLTPEQARAMRQTDPFEMDVAAADQPPDDDDTPVVTMDS